MRMADITWGYTNRGDRRHIAQPEPTRPGPGDRCCNPDSVRRCCGFSGTALCGAVLTGEVTAGNLRYWVPCQRCLALKRPTTPCNCGADCDKANDTCYGEVEAVDEIEVDDSWDWLHMCERHRDDRD